MGKEHCFFFSENFIWMLSWKCWILEEERLEDGRGDMEIKERGKGELNMRERLSKP